jgi:hypothetical protein
MSGGCEHITWFIGKDHSSEWNIFSSGGLKKKIGVGTVFYITRILSRAAFGRERKEEKKRNLDTSSMRAYTTTTSRATNLPPPPTHLNQTLNTFSVFFGFNLILLFFIFHFF